MMTGNRITNEQILVTSTHITHIHIKKKKFNWIRSNIEVCVYIETRQNQCNYIYIYIDHQETKIKG